LSGLVMYNSPYSFKVMVCTRALPSNHPPYPTCLLLLVEAQSCHTFAQGFFLVFSREVWALCDCKS
jgi:hypothetical protein